MLLDEKQYDEALKTLDAKTDEAFAPCMPTCEATCWRRPASHDARSAYQIALAKLDPKSGYRAYVEAKLDALGGPLPVLAGAPGAPATAATAPPAPPAGPAK